MINLRPNWSSSSSNNSSRFSTFQSLSYGTNQCSSCTPRWLYSDPVRDTKWKCFQWKQACFIEMIKASMSPSAQPGPAVSKHTQINKKPACGSDDYIKFNNKSYRDGSSLSPAGLFQVLHPLYPAWAPASMPAACGSRWWTHVCNLFPAPQPSMIYTNDTVQDVSPLYLGCWHSSERGGGPLWPLGISRRENGRSPNPAAVFVFTRHPSAGLSFFFWPHNVVFGNLWHHWLLSANGHSSVVCQQPLTRLLTAAPCF